jgi:cobalt/nickel transport system permease protein
LSPRGLRVLAWLGGSILVRSYERSEWVYKAMLLRGYGHAPHPRGEFHARSSDMITLGFFLLIAAGFVAGQILCGLGPGALLQ